MSGTDSNLGEKLARLAEGVLDEMLSTDGETPKPTLDQRIDAIKVIGALHLGIRRLRGTVPEETDESGGLPAMRERMRQAAEKGK